MGAVSGCILWLRRDKLGESDVGMHWGGGNGIGLYQERIINGCRHRETDEEEHELEGVHID